MAVNLGKRSRWFQVGKYLEDNNGAALLLISILTILMVAKCCDECKGKWLGAVKNSSKGTIYQRRYFARPYIYCFFLKEGKGNTAKCRRHLINLRHLSLVQRQVLFHGFGQRIPK